MTQYRFPKPQIQQTVGAREAKARRQAVLQRVRAQRAVAYKRSIADWMEEGLLMRGDVYKASLAKKVQRKTLQEDARHTEPKHS